TDGRYTIQLKRQVDEKLFEALDGTKIKPGAWIAANLREGVIGYDPWLHTPAQIKALQKELAETEVVLRAATPNPLDELWTDRPAARIKTAEIFPLHYAGMSALEKLDLIAGKVAEQGADATVIARPDSICWMLNVR